MTYDYQLIKKNSSGYIVLSSEELNKLSTQRLLDVYKRIRNYNNHTCNDFCCDYATSEFHEKTEEEIHEHNIKNLMNKKQNFQLQLSEVDDAMKEIESEKAAYKIVGNIMVKKNSEDLKKDLEQMKQMIEIRMKTIEKQENKMKEEKKDLQEKVMSNMKK